MAFMKTLLIASVAVFVAAAPGYGESAPAAEAAPAKEAAPAMHAEPAGNTEVEVDGQDNGAVCGNGQKIACCNSGEDLIGANCLSIPIREFDLISSTMRRKWRLMLMINDSGHPHPEGLRLQRRRLLPDWRRRGQPHQPRAQLPGHSSLSVVAPTSFDGIALFPFLVDTGGTYKASAPSFFASSTSFLVGVNFLTLRIV